MTDQRKLKVQDLPTSDAESGGTGSSSDRNRGCGGNSELPCFPQVRQIMSRYGGATPSKKSSVTSLRTPASASASSRRQPLRNAKQQISTPCATPGPSVMSIPNMQTDKILDPVQVFCRVRPLINPSDDDSCIRILGDASILLTPPDNPAYWKQGIAKEQTYAFRVVFDEIVNQRVIFDGIALPLVKDFLEGKNALLFAYGVTGSGKTFTMSGTPSEPGIMPRCLDVIFNSISGLKAGKYVFKPDHFNGFETQSTAEAMMERQRELPGMSGLPKTPRPFRGYGGTYRPQAAPEVEPSGRLQDPTVLPLLNQGFVYSVFISYVEVYNNSVFDLLDESPIDINKRSGVLQSKMLREDISKNIYVHGVSEVEVESADEAYDVFNRGQRRRRMAHTALNAESSRSHSIFTIRLVQAPYDSDGETVINDKSLMCVSQLSLVDLAGSERYGRSRATGDRLKEAGSINKSLMTLRQCLDYLRKNQQNGTSTMIPYRESKLTHYLKNYFEGEGRVRMVLCVNPASVDYDENIHVLEFAELTQEVQVTRPQPQVVKIDPVTPGRRKATEMYKERESKRRIVEGISDEDLVRSDSNMIFSLGPPLPICKMVTADDPDSLSNLRRALESRVNGRRDLQGAKIEKRNHFRAQLVRIERNMETMLNENDSLKIKLDSLNNDKRETEDVLRMIQSEKSRLESKFDEQERQLLTLQQELDSCRNELRQREVIHLKEQERLKSDLDLQLEHKDSKRQRKLQKEEAKLKAEYKGHEEKLEAVRQLVSDVPVIRRSSRSRHSFPAPIESFTSSDSDIPSVMARSESVHLPYSHSRVGSAPIPVESPNRHERRGAPAPLHTTRRFRSQSGDNEKWLEHTPGLALKQQTVFQPIMKKKKSVNKLSKAGDVVSNTSKYCLRTQEHDTDGELETKLYKADVLKTVTGGAQVVFHDVEILKQVSPTGAVSPTRKRTSAGPRTPSRYDNNGHDYGDDPESVTLRCTMGIGHNNPTKRSRQT